MSGIILFIIVGIIAIYELYSLIREIISRFKSKKLKSKKEDTNNDGCTNVTGNH